MTEWRIDLFSDTKTRPTAAMRAAMAAAVVGDEQQDEDPTVAALNARVADMLGKPAAIFLPSGTMANLISTLVHCQRGDEVLAEASSHVFHFETGGPAGIAGATLTPLQGRHGVLDPADVKAALRAPRRNAPRPRLVWVEQTTNMGGGAIWPLAVLQSMRRLADAEDLTIHIDGARLMNAAVASGVAPAEYGAIAESLWIDFTKGLGAPFGAVLAGAPAFIDAARRYKHMLGGAMRQAGMMAAACLYALDHNVDRLGEDHVNAARLAAGLRQMPGVKVLGDVETNIVIVDIADAGLTAAELNARLAPRGVRGGVFGATTLRLITHLDVCAADIDTALSEIRAALRAGA